MNGKSNVIEPKEVHLANELGFCELVKDSFIIDFEFFSDSGLHPSEIALVKIY